MKQLLFALIAGVGLGASAQEIGTEITPSTPTSGVQTQPVEPQPVEPPPQPQQNTGYQYRPRGQQTPAAPSWSGTKVSAASGDFGIRASFGASGSTALPTTSTGASVAAPSVGIAFFGTDSFKLLADLGVGFGLTSGNPLLSLGVLLGFDYLFRTPGDALRPFFHFAGTFNLGGSFSNMNVGFGAQLGFGAEYFFSPNLSLNGRLLLAVPMAVPGGNFVLGIFTVTPGVGATWYF